MPKIDPYESRASDYDRWFERHPHVYEAELEAVRRLVPSAGKGVEIGVGTGRFAHPLRVTFGVDPSPAMMKIAATRGIDLVAGTAEYLSLRPSVCDFVMMITILHLLDDVPAAVAECYRVLVPGGNIIIAYIERDSPMGREYSRPAADDTTEYYRQVHFYSTDEVLKILRQSGFRNPTFLQTIFRAVDDITDHEPVEKGHDRGSFVVVRAEKPV
jgi:ubiquinone/menaquinone biosynthesis C-methylase UbiE